MLIIISPAKTLDFESPTSTQQFTQPDYLEDSALLIERLRQMDPPQISKLMSISAKLADLNVQRNLNWQQPFTVDNARQSIFAFKGDVYAGLNVSQFSEVDLLWMQDHLRILSGLYGLLRPLDLMQAYRLEMGSRLDNVRGKNLYQFWQDKLTQGLNQQLQTVSSNLLVNLASNEYADAVDMKQIDAEVISPQFKDWKNDQYKIISFFAKKARGIMSAWIVANRVTEQSDLLAFDGAGYRYSEAHSSPQRPVFIRQEQ